MLGHGWRGSRGRERELVVVVDEEEDEDEENEDEEGGEIKLDSNVEKQSKRRKKPAFRPSDPVN